MPKSKLNQSKQSTKVEDVKAIEEPDSKLKFWEKKAMDNIHTCESTRVASVLKNLEANHKVVEDISEIKINIKDIK
jgi:hypothetical protein